MKKQGKERLFEVMSRLDSTFKPKLNENNVFKKDIDVSENKWYGDSTSYSEYIDELKHFVKLVDNKKFDEAKSLLKRFNQEGKIGGLKTYLTEFGEFEVQSWVTDNLKDVISNNDTDGWDERMDAFKGYFN